MIAIFADCNCDKDSKKSSKKRREFIEPFPIGTEKVPYVCQDIINTQTGLEEGLKIEENENNHCRTDSSPDKNIIQLEMLETPENENNYNTYDISDNNYNNNFNNNDNNIQINPYDIPDDF